MASVIRAIEGRAIVTVNDHPDMREVFAGLDFERIEIQYTLGGAEALDRVGNCSSTVGVGRMNRWDRFDRGLNKMV